MSRIALLLALALTAGGCADTFAPRVAGGRAFAVFGTLDGRTARQTLRVQDLASAVLETPDRLAATVTSTELTTGRTTRWRDSVVTLADGMRAHLFVADLAVASGETHRIDLVRDDDGERTTVTIELPSPTVVSATSPPNSSAAVLSVANLGGRLMGPVVRYRVQQSNGASAVSFTSPASLQDTGAGLTFVTFLDIAEAQATQLLFGSGMGDPVLVDARLEGIAVSEAPVPASGGVGGVGWAVPVSAPIPFMAATLLRVGFVDGR